VTWNADQYRRFAAERSLPFVELLTMIERPTEPAPVRRVVDLGCGPGELTARLAAELDADVLGIDNSPAMLAAAEQHRTNRVAFADGDIAAWTADGDVDLVVASASLQWVADHPTVLRRWRDALAPGGQLAVQVPANADSPTHTVAAAVAMCEPYLSAFGAAGPPPDPVARNVLTPEHYARVLYELGFEHQEVRLRVYPHVLAQSRDAVEWVKGTTLTRFAEVLPAPLYERFLVDYEAALLAEVGESSPFFFPFKRILFVARRPG
jgi:trans-aconitate 2-methyltransferase